LENENANVKKKSKGLIIGIIAAVAVIIAAVVLFVFKPWAAGYVAVVDNMKITKYEYTFFSKFNMNQFLTNNNLTTKTTPDKYEWNTKVGTETAKDSVKKNTLEQIQELKIQIIKANEAGLKLEASDMKNVDDAINSQISQYGSRNAAEESVQGSYGVTLSEMKEIYKNLTLAQKYQTTVIGKVTVSDDDVKKYYDENKKNFDKVTVTHILIKTIDENSAPVSAGKKAEAKKKADDLLARVKAGEDIKALAEKYSEDKPAVTTKDSLGYQGVYTFGKGEMDTNFEEWAFGDRKAGDTGIVETVYGYHIMQFQKRAETPLDTIKANLKSSLLTQKQSEELNKKMDEFKKDTKYAVKPNESVITQEDKILYRV
jgi:foldase protein PrsA